MPKINQRHSETFSVLDESNQFISGLNIGDFTVQIYNPSDSEVSSSISVQLDSIGVGHYKLSFIPNVIGYWYVTIKHAVYFPWGKESEIYIQTNETGDISTILDTLSTINGEVSNIGSDVTSFGGMISNIQDDITIISGEVTTLVNIESGKWKITGNQMIFYGPDNTSELMRFMLYDKDGNPTETNVFERRKVV